MPGPRQEVSLGRKLPDSESIDTVFAIDKWLRKGWRDRLGFGVLGSVSQWSVMHTQQI